MNFVVKQKNFPEKLLISKQLPSSIFIHTFNLKIEKVIWLHCSYLWGFCGVYMVLEIHNFIHVRAGLQSYFHNQISPQMKRIKKMP